MNMSNALDISLVIPLYNEEESLRPLHAQLSQALGAVGRSYEIIFVDDGSTDGSFAVLEELHQADEHVKALQFRRNFGKSAALSAGFREARGEIIITMDADLQDDPQEIPNFLSTVEQGYDLVSGWKFPRRDPLTRTLPSRLFNWTVCLLTGVNLHDLNCGFKAYRRGVVEEISIYGELHRYIPVLAHWRGFKVTEIKVRHHPRPFGRSKYGLSRFGRGFFDLLTVLFLTQYLRRPLHLFGWLGMLFFAAGMIANLYLTVLWFVGVRPIGNRPLLTLGVLLLIIGVQFISFGLLAELIAKMSSPTSEDYSIRRKL
jgi:glycosyltransferase involved in cell wall biosynthesis